MTEMIGIFNVLNEISSRVYRASRKAGENSQDKLVEALTVINSGINQAVEAAEGYMQDDKDNNAD